MNNSNFALMRYFRDLGVDAHLLLYANDGILHSSHFKPECDTWSVDKWQPYIHQTDIPDTSITALDFPISLMVSLYSLPKFLISPTDFFFQRSISRRKILQVYQGYDKLVGSGISPAVMNRVGLILDIFYPYSSGVEYLKSAPFINACSGLFGIKQKLICSTIINRQKKGICSAASVLNFEMGRTEDALRDIGVTSYKLPIPMVYNNESLPLEPPTSTLYAAMTAISKADLSILHHARLLWKCPPGYSDDTWLIQNKNNNWLLHAFAALVKNRPNIKPILLIVEYGRDIDVTKQLASELGIEAYIYWLPVLKRREIMWLLQYVSIGVGEFRHIPRTIWGGTGWEVLASAKPLLQSFSFASGEFERLCGYPEPPMLPVRNQEDILQHLLDMADYPERRHEIGHAAKDWFDHYNGIELAKQWLEILLTPHTVKAA